MTCPEFAFNRRNFIAATATLGVTGLAASAQLQHGRLIPRPISTLSVPKPGYSPQIGTLVWVRPGYAPLSFTPSKGCRRKILTTSLIECQHHPGSMLLLHLAATETYYR